MLENIVAESRGNGSSGGTGHPDGAGRRPSPFVRLMIELFRATVRTVEKEGIKNEDEFFTVLDTFHKLGAEPVSISMELKQEIRTGEILAWLRREDPPTDRTAIRVYGAAITVLTRHGILIAGRRYDPFSGQPRV